MTNTTRRSRMLDYAPPIVAFIAAVAAVVGAPKWDAASSGISKVTPYGWLVLAIGLAALTASLAVTVRSRREQVNQRQARERISSIGRHQLLGALQHTVHPLFGDSIWRRQCEAPKSPSDMLDRERRGVLSTLDLNSNSSYADGSLEEIKWFRILERAASEGVNEMKSTLQIFSGYLSPEVMDATSRVMQSSFLRFRLLRIGDIVQANTQRDAHRAVPFFWVAQDERHDQEYEEFWNAIGDAMVVCEAERQRADGPKLGVH